MPENRNAIKGDETVAVNQSGSCELFVLVADLAEAIGRIPVGEWAYTFQSDPRYLLWVNGGAHDHWQPEACPALIDRFFAYLEFNGWPAALFCPSGGSVTVPEAQLLEAFTIEIAHVGAR